MNDSQRDRDEFFYAYLECAVWSQLDWTNCPPEQNPVPLDENYSVLDILPEAMVRLREECDDFITANIENLDEWEPGQAGHDFWLTRNGHGAGFWARGLASGDDLTEAAHAYGEADLFPVSGGKVDYA